MTASIGANTKAWREILKFSEMERPVEPQGDTSSDTHAEGPLGRGGVTLPGSSLPPATPAQQVSQTGKARLGAVLPHLFRDWLGYHLSTGFHMTPPEPFILLRD